MAGKIFKKIIANLILNKNRFFVETMPDKKNGEERAIFEALYRGQSSMRQNTLTNYMLAVLNTFPSLENLFDFTSENGKLFIYTFHDSGGGFISIMKHTLTNTEEILEFFSDGKTAPPDVYKFTTEHVGIGLDKSRELENLIDASWNNRKHPRYKGRDGRMLRSIQNNTMEIMGDVLKDIDTKQEQPHIYLLPNSKFRDKNND